MPEPTTAPTAQTSNTKQSDVDLSTVLLAGELGRRPGREPDLAAENATYLALAERLTDSPDTLLQALMDAALVLCDAGTAGVSLLDTDADVFRWTVLAGRLASHINGTTPRDFSPCGVCLDNERPELFSHPERRFTYFAKAGVPFVEALVLPFYVDRQPAGTIWILTHEPTHHFDMEDVRIMTRLAAFTGSAYSLLRRGASVMS
ncbi:MAG: GAF domain-containing protein [Gemmatimonadaceae bacterium]